MESFLITLGAFFMVLPFFIWSGMAFYSRKNRKPINNFTKIVLLLIIIGFILGICCIVMVVFLF
ncbi:hypothetical protein [Spiroplasma taiwanense]|uniref:Transmembrane protein n=1 Tax=Spiroplasma taiwanense CT-1 TaxID=1276220 RepID=S5LZE8_9MOLU|nr:hypothetical protein [Spiroplasma taiwanense]AGR41082.1 hypothetical protein STAIW_v1c04360 [Spiroplasma taiwanense CT-1]